MIPIPMRFRAPAEVTLRRAQMILMMVSLVPVILTTATAIVLLALGSSSVVVIAGVLVLAFCATALTGAILAAVFLSRGASITRVQHDFLSSVSHELRTPLTSMQMFIETLRDGRVTDPEEQRKCLDVVHGELRRLDTLVSRLLELSRIQSGRHAYERLPINVSELLSEAVASFRAASLGEDAQLRVEAAEDLWVRGDRAALGTAVGNLLTNAWKYGAAAEDGRILLSARPAGKRVEITVADNGAGVPAAERGRVFEHFERGRAAVDGRKPGVGLGLATVRAIVGAHRGRVELDSDGAGARFTISLRRLAAKEIPTS